MPINIDPITALPTPPTKADPANFAERADGFLGALPGFAAETNAAITEINKITSGLDQATPIAAWVAGTTYDFPGVVAGSDGYSYRCVGTGVVGVDPVSDDGSNWIRIAEAPLGNPTSDGMVLLSTIAGVRSWGHTTRYLELYERADRPANGGSDTAVNRRSIVVGNTDVLVDGIVRVLTGATFDLDDAASWDTIAPTNYSTASNRAGKDFYLYAHATGFIISANATYPSGYTAANSRKIAGFHCLGVNVGAISGHTLTGYLQGDILPASVWDLKHRPVSSPEGMVYDAGTGKWVDIYLAGISGGELVSRYGVAHQTGVSTEKFHWYKFSQWFGRIGKRMLRQHEFVAASMGSNQGTNITGSADPATTGGHVDTAGRRMISNIGCEGMCGILWQWGDETGAVAGSAAWVSAFDANDTGVGGQHYQAPTRPLLGGDWAPGAFCGSRSSAWNIAPLTLYSYYGSRGCAEPWAGGA